jgi:hypothetical protein
MLLTDRGHYPVERQNVESIELHLVIVLAGMQRVEIGDAVDAEDDRLAVEDELLMMGFSERPRRSRDSAWSSPWSTRVISRTRSPSRSTRRR